MLLARKTISVLLGVDYFFYCVGLNCQFILSLKGLSDAPWSDLNLNR